MVNQKLHAMNYLPKCRCVRTFLDANPWFDSRKHPLNLCILGGHLGTGQKV